MRDRERPDLVTTSRDLLAGGVTRSQLRAEVATGRWRRSGTAVVLHNGPPSAAQRRRLAQVHAGPRALFTAFTATQLLGLRGWERDATHVVVPAGTRVRAGCPVPVRLHYSGTWPVSREPGQTIELLAHAVLRAAGTFSDSRPGCGLLAAAVQQRLLPAERIREAFDSFPRLRHRRVLLAAIHDIEGGSEALSEIDFVRLCRRNGLPEPLRQVLRREPGGRRRYLDATWRRSDGRLVVAEVDGALHLAPARWWDDQARQNELALADALVLRFPSVVLRTDERRVAAQLRRALRLTT